MKILCITLTICGSAFFSNAQSWLFGTPERLGGTINVEESEESIPVFSEDSATLYFVRTFDENNKGGLYDQDVWYATRDDNGNFSESKNLKGINNKLNNAIVGLGGKSGSMYLLNAYEGNKDTIKGIASSERNGSGWSKPEKVNIPSLVIPGNFYGFHVDHREKVIIISYDGPGSKGEEDLYFSVNEGGSWTRPKHMGNAINSSGFEISPFLSKSGDTLFFSSNGFGGQGDADIFYSVKQGAWDQWSAPVNLGSEINSPKFDAYFIFANNEVYWSSNRDGQRSDIYRAEILPPPPLFASAVGIDCSAYQTPDGSIDCTPKGGIPPYSFKWSNGSEEEDPDGLLAGVYFVQVKDAIGQIADLEVPINEPPLEVAEVEVKNYDNLDLTYFFTYNKNKVNASKREMKKFLKDILGQLEDGRSKITVKVNSSASQVPTKSFSSNEELAKTRAENIKYDLVSYFQKKGHSDKVTVVVESSKVQGPEYADDARNRSKYEEFQYVKLATE